METKTRKKRKERVATRPQERKSPVSPLNGLPVRAGVEGRLSFLVAGHTYGWESGDVGSRTILASLAGLLREAAPSALLWLGDTIIYPRMEVVGNLAALYQSLPVPVFVAPGNHDTMVYGPDRFSLSLNFPNLLCRGRLWSS